MVIQIPVVPKNIGSIRMNKTKSKIPLSIVIIVEILTISTAKKSPPLKILNPHLLSKQSYKL